MITAIALLLLPIACFADLSPVIVDDELAQYSHLCPDLPANLAYSNIANYHFYTSHAEIALTVAPDSTDKIFRVTYYLPALPPFCRSARADHPDPDYDRGDKNWAFAGTFVHDYAFRLIEHSELVHIKDQGDMVLCIYRSLVENHFINGSIVTKKDDLTVSAF